MTTLENSQLVDIKTYEPKEQMVFSERVSSIKEGMTFERIDIYSMNKDNTKGYLIIETEKLYSYGIKKNSFGKSTSYTLPLCLMSRENPTRKESLWIDNFQKIVDHSVEHLQENSEDDLEMTSPIYNKDSPTIYPKLDLNCRTKTFGSELFDEKDKPIKIEKLIDKPFNVQASILVKSIFFGESNISIQLRVLDGVVSELKKEKRKRCVRAK